MRWIILLLVLFSIGCVKSIDCKDDEVPIFDCQNKKEIVTECMPDPFNCAARPLDHPCAFLTEFERQNNELCIKQLDTLFCKDDGNCQIKTTQGTCDCPHCEIISFRCIPKSKG